MCGLACMRHRTLERKAKVLGIKMNVPLVQVRERLRHYGVQSFSSTYAL